MKTCSAYTSCPSLLLRGMATGIRTPEETGHPLSRRTSPDHRLGHLVPTRGRGVDLGRFDGGGRERQTGVGSVYQTLASSSHHRLVFATRFLFPGQVCLFANHLKGEGWTRTFTRWPQDGWPRTRGQFRSLGWWTHSAMAVRRIPFDWRRVSTKQFAPLAASLAGTGGPFTPCAAAAAVLSRTDNPCVATVATQLGWDTRAPTHTFPRVFPNRFPRTKTTTTPESRRVTTSNWLVDSRSTTTESKPIDPSGAAYQYHHHRL